VLPRDGYDYNSIFHGVDQRVPVVALQASTRIPDRFLMSDRGGEG
jgi:hypothetical protein